MFFLEFKNIQQSKIRNKKGHKEVENYSASILTFGTSSNFALKGSKRAKMRENCILRGGSLIRDTPYKLAFPGRNRAWVISKH